MRRRLALGILAIAPVTATAQRITGVVRVSDSNTPLAGVVVSTLDSAGASLNRSLSDQNGRYSVAIDRRSAALRAQRIGFRPATIAIRGIESDSVIDLSIDRAAVVLEGMRVSATTTCGGATDGRGPSEAWEQARSALLAAIVAREAKPARVQLLEYTRRMERVRRLITEQQIKISVGLSRRPITVARTPAQLAAEGFKQGDATGNIFFAPDADVLFDAAFTESHCFGSVSGTADHSGHVGLTFKPSAPKRDFVDVEGVLWIDPRASELLQIDFRYTGLDQEATRAGAGGTLHLRRMTNGVVFIDSWSILVPTITEVRELNPRGLIVSSGAVSELVESGGYIFDASWPDSTHWSDPLGGVRGRIRDSKDSVGVAGVSLSTTGAVTVSDMRGEYSFSPLPPGRYQLLMADSLYAAFVRPRRQSKVVEIGRRDTAHADFDVPSREVVLGELCRHDSSGRRGILLGHLITGSDTPSDMRVEASWYAAPGGSASDLANVSRSTRIVEVNATGRFFICGLPWRSSPIDIRLFRGRTPIADTSLVPGTFALAAENGTRSLNWPVSREALAGALQGDAAALRGTVARNGRPVGGAEVWLILADTTVLTDSLGKFHVGGLRAGPHLVQIRHIGYAVKRDTVLLRPQEETLRDFAMDGAQLLDTVRAIGAGRAYDVPRLQEFERRRLSGLGGNFISEDELRAADAVQFSNVVRTHVQGASVEVNGGQAYLVARGATSIGGTGRACYATIFVDGLLLYDGPAAGAKDNPPDLNQFMTANLSGVEYYRGGASLPLQFRSRRNDCGTLLLWTRGK